MRPILAGQISKEFLSSFPYKGGYNFTSKARHFVLVFENVNFQMLISQPFRIQIKIRLRHVFLCIVVKVVAARLTRMCWVNSVEANLLLRTFACGLIILISFHFVSTFHLAARLHETSNFSTAHYGRSTHFRRANVKKPIPNKLRLYNIQWHRR